MKVSKYVCGAVRQFSLWFAKGSLGYPLLNGIDYTGEILKEESSFAEQAYAIFMNNCNYSVLLRNPQFLHKVEKWKRAEKNQRNVNIQEAKKVIC